MYDIKKALELNKKLIYDTQEYISNNPETGYKEYKTNKYMATEK